MQKMLPGRMPLLRLGDMAIMTTSAIIDILSARKIFTFKFVMSKRQWILLLSLLLAGILCSCKKEEPTVVEIRPTPGDIQILNSCGIAGAAGKMRDYLRKQGFDVVEVSDDVLWNYEETVIALRNPHWAGAEALAKALQTTNVIPLENKRKLIDATVYIGKDFHKIIGQEQP